MTWAIPVLVMSQTPSAGLAKMPASTSDRIRHVANGVNLSTSLGLLVARVGGARIRRGPMALYLADHYRFGFPVADAFTIGDVVLSRHDLDHLLARWPALLEHEEAHSRQWMWCLGMPFFPCYVAAMAWSWLRTGDRAACNVFECQADLVKGGYAEVPPRALGPVTREAGRRLRAAMIRGDAAGDLPRRASR